MNNKNKFGKTIRADERFAKELNKIIGMRIQTGKEAPQRHNGTRRITLAITRHPSWQKMKEDIANADFKREVKEKLEWQ